MKTALLALTSSIFMSVSGWAANETPEFEGLCRIKAKEVAAETYKSCVTEARSSQIDQLKKEYQDKLKQMKDEYERELKRLSAGGKANAGSTSALAPQSNKKSAAKSKATAKAKSAAGSASAKALPGKSAASATSEEMSVELKQAPAASVDESIMDVPEPVPVEEVPTAGL